MAGWIAVAIFVVVLAFVAFVVIREMWQFMRGEFEPESGGSYGRQLFGRRPKGGGRGRQGLRGFLSRFFSR